MNFKSTCISVFIVFFIFPFLSGAKVTKRKPSNENPPLETLKEKALKEIKKIESPPPTAPNSSKENIFLKLEAPQSSSFFSNSQYWVSMKVQSFQPEGLIAIPSLGTLNLSKTSSTLMPSLEMGFQKKLDAETVAPIKIGFSAELGYASQSNALSLNSGTAISDPHLTTFLFNSGLYLSWSPTTYPLFEFFVSPQLGVVSYHQNSANDAANFSEQNSFNQLSLGAHYLLAKNKQLTAIYMQKSLNSSNDNAANIQHRNAQLGVRFLW